MSIRFRRALAIASALAVLVPLAVLHVAEASNPTSGSVSPTSPTVTWTGGVGEPATDPTVGACSASDNDGCDTFTLNVTPGGAPTEVLHVSITADPTDDYDLYVFGPGGSLVGSSAGNQTLAEAVAVPNPVAGAYVVRVRPFMVTGLDGYQGTASLANDGTASSGLTPTATWFFTSASGGYQSDLAADPSATTDGRAPAGSALTTARPVGATDAVAEPRGSADSSGTPNTPTWSVPGAAVAGSLCIDAWVSRPSLAGNAGLFPSFAAPGVGSESHDFANATPPADTTPTHVRVEVASTGSPVQIGADWALRFASYADLPSTFFYGSTEHPSSVTINPPAGSCMPIVSDAGVVPAPASATPAPSYVNYAAPDGFADDAGEPSIGWLAPQATAMFQAGFSTSAVTFDDSTSPPTATWNSRPSFLTSNLASLDSILATDRVTGRTMVTQLLGACSGASFSDDAGVSWLPSQGCPQPHGVDHETLGFGPAVPGSPQSLVAQNGRLAYYCSQDIVTAFCGTSLDGGATFGPSSTVFTVADGCGNAFHGHVKVSEETGFAFLPSERCGGQAVSVSKDNGLTWQFHLIPGFSAVSNLTHPSIAVKGHTVYFANGDANGRPVVSISHDDGETWSTPMNVAPGLGLASVEFPVVAVGDEDRAAFAFLGTTTPGDYSTVGFGDHQDADGIVRNDVTWHLYVAHSYDGGASWSVTDATPTDPVQRGCLWANGTTTGAAESACRNLLDFNGIAVDNDGRVLIGWADGCTGTCVGSTVVADNARTARGTISRMGCGLSLFAAKDAVTGCAPAPTTCTRTTRPGPLSADPKKKPKCR